jgi:hypothetical protein
MSGIFKQRSVKMNDYIAKQIAQIGGRYADEVFFTRAYNHSFPNQPCNCLRFLINQYEEGIINEVTREYVRYLQG